MAITLLSVYKTVIVCRSQEDHFPHKPLKLTRYLLSCTEYVLCRVPPANASLLKILCFSPMLCTKLIVV